jgi:hypothetical protein
VVEVRTRRLRVNSWPPDDLPKKGDAIRTRRGTFYGILSTRVLGARLTSIVVVRLLAEPEGCRVFDWRWEKRRSRA